MARILVAEDDQALKDFISRALAGDGHDVVAVDDGSEAMDTLSTRAFDLLLTDIEMPGLDGLSLARHCLAHHADMRILLMTGVTTDLDGGLQSAAQVKGLMSKPFSLDQLRSEVKAAL